ncbi:outer membrane beta-barrel protein [Capnocytophaga leadbetteri]|uniref:outer membrane beta-barrel protein n=1 Tax=Capnocytophaga leadbetteri TaxID=327575 RepID=UPI0028EB6C93|nr:outer membrane beta-barrel protein [Capnocytophaga leadbetteri]
MKKLFLLAAVAFASASYAQTEKGNWFAGSDLGLSYTSETTTPKYDGTKGSETTVSTLKFTPNVNYFVIDNLAVGLGLEYTNSKVKGASDSESTLAIVPNATYFFPLSANLAPFIGAKVGYAMESDGSADNKKNNGLVFGGKAGIAYFVNQGAAITGYVGYDNYSLKNKADSKIETQRGLLAVGVGVALFF